MKELILNEINHGTTLQKLSTLTNQSEKKVGVILRMLENDGYVIHRFINGDGVIHYYFTKNLDQKPFTIMPTSQTTRALAIADLHVGVLNDGMHVIDDVINYALKNDIHLVFVLGDIFEGLVYRRPLICENLEEQINRLFKKWPYNSNMVFMMLYGNHDLSIMESQHFDIRKRLAVRPDFIDLGYGVGKVQLGKDLIWLQHDLVFVKQPEIIRDARIILKGHSHLFDIHDNIIGVPALLNSRFHDDVISTGFLDITFIQDSDGYTDELVVRHLPLLKGFNVASEIVVPVKTPKIKKKI